MARADTPDTGSGPPLTDERSYRHWTAEKIRFQDIDRHDHVNNVTFAAYAESGRLEFLADIMRELPSDDDGAFWVIARLCIDFLEQTHYPGEIRIGTRVLEAGRSSVTLGQGLFEGARCVATARSTVVLLDPDTGRSMPLPKTVKKALAAHMP